MSPFQTTIPPMSFSCTVFRRNSRSWTGMEMTMEFLWAGNSESWWELVLVVSLVCLASSKSLYQTGQRAMRLAWSAQPPSWPMICVVNDPANTPATNHGQRQRFSKMFYQCTRTPMIQPLMLLMGTPQRKICIGQRSVNRRKVSFSDALLLCFIYSGWPVDRNEKWRW